MTNTMALAIACLAAALGLLNLVLTYGAIRRLREHTRLLADTGTGTADPATPPAGTPVPAFTASTIDGDTVTRDDVTGMPAFIGFFSVTCAPCREQLPAFLDVLAGMDDARVLVVISGSSDAPEHAEAMVARARGRARVVVEERPALGELFTVNRYPTMLAVNDGVLIANAQVATRLPIPVMR